MAIQHISRRGDVYYLHQGKTKTGKPKWFFSMKQTGDLADAIPDGFEVYETPNGQVSLRKQLPRLIREDEIALVEKSVRELARLFDVVVEAKGKDIIVHVHEGGGTYLPMMRFELVEERARDFLPYRWCFRGSIEGWFHLSGCGPLAKLANKYVRHLGQDSFFELM